MHFAMFLYGTIIPTVDKVRYLELYLGQRLTWIRHDWKKPIEATNFFSNYVTDAQNFF